MNHLRAMSIAVAFAAAIATAPRSGIVHAQAQPADPLAAEIARWSAAVASPAPVDPIFAQVKGGSEPLLAQADEALHDGRRLLALDRLAAARQNLAAARYVAGRPAAERQELPRFEAEWTRMGAALPSTRNAPQASAFESVRPAAVRAVGEAALFQVRVYYASSLEYGRNTTPESGLFYLGTAQAQDELAALCRALSASSTLQPPAIRRIDGELDDLEARLLALYRPPASIDRHSEFIGASATLKEARELNGAGLRYGALLRYLQASLRIALLAPPVSLDAAALADRLRQADAQLSGAVDHTVGRMLLERAQREAARSSGGVPPIAAAVVTDVLPRYLAALAPEPPRPARPAAQVTITLVRWPYT